MGFGSGGSNFGSGTAAVARTGTADGTGTGLIADGTYFVTVTVTDAAHLITLPAPIPGTIVWLGCQAETDAWELQSSAPDTVAINGNTPTAGDSSTVGATITLVRCVCVNATNWIGTTYSATGVPAALEAAA